MILDEHGNPISSKPDRSRLELLKDGQQPTPEFQIIVEPGTGATGVRAELRYKHHLFTEALPETFLSWDENSRNFFILPVMERLQLQLRPILIAEDDQPPCGVP
jgi:hypothetical protein